MSLAMWLYARSDTFRFYINSYALPEDVLVIVFMLLAIFA